MSSSLSQHIVKEAYIADTVRTFFEQASLAVCVAVSITTCFDTSSSVAKVQYKHVI